MPAQGSHGFNNVRRRIYEQKMLILRIMESAFTNKVDSIE
jgi:hypothetical protein